MNLKNIKMQPKLIGLMLLISLIPLGSVSYWAATKSSDALVDAAFSQLTSLRSVKAKQVGDLVEKFKADSEVLSATVQSMYAEVDVTQKDIVSVTQDAFFNKYMSTYGYYDLFLVDKNGRVIKRYSPSTKPMEMEKDIEDLL